jgi:hypothetical protein
MLLAGRRKIRSMKAGKVVFVLLVLFLGACSTGGDTKAGFTQSGSGAPRGGKASSSPGPGATGEAGSARPAASAGSSVKPAPSPTWTPDDFVSVRANRFTGWACAKRPGDVCQVPLVGSYFMIGSNVGAIQFVVFENGSKAPAVKSAESPVVAGGNSFESKFSYKIGSGARTASFQAWLKDDRGVILAKSELDTVKLAPPA